MPSKRVMAPAASPSMNRPSCGGGEIPADRLSPGAWRNGTCSLRTTLITLAAMPLSFGITFLVFNAFEISVNSMTLGGLALGVGGVPRGRITEIFGPESSGKTTVCQHILAEAQKLGGVVAFIDVEHALDPMYARACGVDVDNLLVSQPDTGEQALEIVETLVRSNAVDVKIGRASCRERV